MKNCKFHNNTSDSLFATKLYQGGAGGVSIGYNFNVTKDSPTDTVTSHITNCTFTEEELQLMYR